MGTVFINQLLVPLASHPDALIVHPHAQRTGGGTLRNHVLAAAFGKERVYSRMFVKDYKPWRKLTDDDLRGFCAYTDLSDYRDLPLARQCLPVALLRYPVYRAVSLYHFVRRKHAHDLHDLAMSHSLEEFYRLGSSINPRYFRNVQTTRICGHTDARMALDYILTRYLAVGFTSNLPEFADMLSRLFGWSGVHVEGKTPDRERYDTQITRTFRDMVLRENEEDLALFEAMSGGKPYSLPKLPVRREVARRARRSRDRALALARGAERRLVRFGFRRRALRE